jgi:uncharacterized membrane protein YhhN
MFSLKKVLPATYIIIGALHVWFTHLAYWQGIYATKCLLMPLLIAWLWAEKSAIWARHKWYLTIGLVFSLIGDLTLMVAQADDKALFLLGLSSFLCTHLFYIATFVSEAQQTTAPHKDIPKNKVVYIIPFLLYAALLLYIIKDFLWQNGLLVPVAIYAAILCTMSLSALNRYGKVPSLSFQWVFVGALLFMFSDSLIAITRFYSPFAWDREMIMLTYIIAQGLIIGGQLKR